MKFECDECQDLQWVNGKPCACQTRKRQRRLFAELVRNLGAIYTPHSLESLQPQRSRHWKQAQLIEAMRANPEASWALFGEKGIGKTLFAFVLARHAIEQGRFVVAVRLRTLLEQLREWEFNDGARPAIVASTLREAETSWCIVLDEIGAISPTPYAGQELLDIVDAIYTSGRHQLIVTAMSDEETLKQHYERAGDGLGGAILRRILDSPNVIKPKDLFELKAPLRVA